MATPSIPNEFSLSTACFGDRLSKIEDQVFTAVAMGFRCLELGLTEAPVTMDGLCEAQRETSTKVGSMVAGCRDVKKGEMIAWKLASSDEAERERALNSIKRHIRLAETWQVPHLIVRGSQVEDEALNRRAVDLQARVTSEGLGEDGADGPLAGEIHALAQEVTEAGQSQLEHLCRGLHELTKVAPDVRFCLEPGGRLDDLLGIEAMGWVLDDLDGICYWHDVAQVHRREAQGLPDQGEWLDRFAGRMGGLHLQDAAGDEIGLPIGLGEVDFKLVAEYAPKQAQRVLEVGARHGRAEILSSVQALIDLGF